jgi:PIN domain nuclease of toxin-antitoxin system
VTNKLLLDTCAAIWVVEGESLSESAVRAISEAVDRAVPVLISPITAWERGLLEAKGRIASPLTPKRWFDVLLSQPGLELAEMSIDILIDSSFLPGQPQGDPADRIIIATARNFDLTIVTRDRAILDYAAQGHVRALAC